MSRAVFVEVGANLVFKIEHDDLGGEPVVTVYRLEITELLKADQAKLLVAALCQETTT